MAKSEGAAPAADEQAQPAAEQTEAPSTQVPVEGALLRDPDDPFGDPGAPKRETYRELKARMERLIEKDGIKRSISFTDVRGPNNSRRRIYFIVAGEYKHENQL